jgi:hypothetical protein
MRHETNATTGKGGDPFSAMGRAVGSFVVMIFRESSPYWIFRIDKAQGSQHILLRYTVENR